MKLTIPYYLHKAGAGFPSPATDYIEEDIDLNMHLIRNVPATFIIRVQGKSMVDVGINDGDLLVVDKSLKPKNFYHFNMKFKLSLVEVIHKHTKCSFDVHVLIHF